MMQIVLTLLVCHPWAWLTWTLPLCRMFLASGHLIPRVRSLGCCQELPRRLFMTLSSNISVPPRNGGQAGSYPMTSLLPGGVGRGICFALCINAKRRWRNSTIWDRPEREFRQGHPGYCPQCKEYVAIALDRHKMNNHLELGQLWRCPVEWCAVWKGSVRDCLDHFREKHGGSQFAALQNLGNIFHHRLSPVTSDLRPFGRTCLAWLWTSHSFMIRDVDWCISIGSTGDLPGISVTAPIRRSTPWAFIRKCQLCSHFHLKTN